MNKNKCYLCADFVKGVFFLSKRKFELYIFEYKIINN